MATVRNQIMKSKRKSYHVVYSKQLKVWRVKLLGKIVVNSISTKKLAIAKGKMLAKSCALGQLVIHKMDGKIGVEYTYPRSSDPRKSKG